MVNFFRALPFLLLILSCSDKESLFKQLPVATTNIDFNNTIIESDSINVMDFENVYNGGGVGVGDFNNDGLQDLYFTGNMVANKMYLNKGKLEFQDITTSAAVEGKGRWCRGVSVVDINNDGWQDLYVCASVKKNSSERENLLYVNQGLDKNNQPYFKEMAANYGLNDTTHSTMAAFFDYDNDGDLDVFICVNQIINGDFPNRFRPRMTKGEHPSTGRLYQNNWNDSLNHPVFTNISSQAGITIEGYSHAVIISDINRDGWQDIYVTNDYLSQNVLYINNCNGTFTDKVAEIFKHTSANAMGSDIVDINNDGLSDLVELDMNPEDNYRKKMMMNANSYQTYTNSDQLGYQYQYVRNTLQLNRGNRILENDSIGNPIFSDISFYSGIAETDWSWTPLIADFDNDGFRDLIVTNGFPKDVTDHDFITYRKEAFSVASSEQLLSQIPEVKIHNYGFRNIDGLRFENMTNEWGLSTKTFSNGAAYVDLDNDGDLDFVINNINDPAMVYQNILADRDKSKAHYIDISLKGDTANRNGLGAWITVYFGNRLSSYEQNPYRGYLSSIQLNPHFGIDTVKMVDSIVVVWPGGRRQVVLNVKADQTLSFDIKDAILFKKDSINSYPSNPLFKNVTKSLGIDFVHSERDFVDFNIQKLLPNKFSESGPAMAVADIDGNGFEDLVVGGSYGKSAVLFFQQKNGKFIQKDLITNASDYTKTWEDAGILIFDADQDSDQDIYIASGGYENTTNTVSYSDHLFINIGAGMFSMDTSALPKNYTSKSCVRATDFDHDGDLDLFLAGRVEPWGYPKSVSSSLYRNDSKDGKIVFTDMTKSLAPTLVNMGMVSDCVWSDFDNDGWTDLVLLGDWMPVSFLKNDKGTFRDISSSTGIQSIKGWWRSIVPGDFDNDGDIDYVAGNLGQNSFYKASEEFPIHIYAKDFDKNDSYDAVPTLYLPATLDNPEKKQFPAHTRDDMTKQMIGFRSKFQNYKLYAIAPFEKMMSAEELKGAQILSANFMSHAFIENQGNGKFEIKALPGAVQFSCINGMVARDVDGDGNLDLIIAGNDYGTEVSVGRYDACNGLLLKGNGNGDFYSVEMANSGIYLPGNARATVVIENNKGELLTAFSQNRGPLQVYQTRIKQRLIKINIDDSFAIVYLKNGKKQKIEFNFGASYLSQSSRVLSVGEAVESVEIINSKSEKRAAALF